MRRTSELIHILSELEFANTQRHVWMKRENRQRVVKRRKRGKWGMDIEKKTSGSMWREKKANDGCQRKTTRTCVEQQNDEWERVGEIREEHTKIQRKQRPDTT